MNDTRQYAIPFAAGIIERMHNGKRQLLIQTRNNIYSSQIYNGTFEFAAGSLDKLYENIYTALEREIKEETGLVLKRIINDSQTQSYKPQKVDESFGFRPFCCVQQLREGKPWIGFIFRCEVEDGEPIGQEDESRDVHWEDYNAVKETFINTPEKLFTLEVPAWEYYFKEVKSD